MKYGLILFIFFFVNIVELNYSVAQTNDSVTKEIKKSEANDSNIIDEDVEDDFTPGLLFFVLIGFGLGLMAIGAGIVLTITGILILFGLVSIGIISTSVLIGINKNSVSKGFKTFVLLASSVGGLVIGISGIYLLNLILHWWSSQTAIMIGASSGLIGGIGIGFTSVWIIRRLTGFLKKNRE